MQMENRKFLKIMELYSLVLFFTDPLRFARPPNLGGQIVVLLFPPLS